LRLAIRYFIRRGFVLIEADVVLDARGMVFPMPLIMTKKAIGEMKPGQVLEVVCTDPDAGPDISELARWLGHEPIEDREVEGLHHFYVRKGQSR
jgi:TusA-related sulfurtransferase